MASKLTLKVKNNREELERIVSAVEGIAEQDDWPEDLLFKINLVVEEIGLNIIDYAFDSGSHEFDLIVTSDAEAVTIEAIDTGRPYDPLSEAPSPDLDAPIECRPVGGLGVYLVRTLMDQSDYRRVDGRNCLTLVKYRTETQHCPE